ncbi:MAG: hydrogenase iron-sulfur subunit, partial [Thermoplasmatota archaeon]
RLHPGGRPAAELAGELERKVRAEPGLELITGAELRSVEGHVGSYTARVATAGGERELRASTIIVATGMEELPPEGAFGHGSLPGVMTLGEFMEALERGRAPASVAFIACVRSRNEERGCCNIGCMAALGAAEALREMAPGARTALFYRDMCVPGPGAAEAEELVWRESILVFRYPDGQPPRVLKGDAPAEVEGHGGASSGGPPWSAREEAGEGAPNASPGGGAEGEGCREGLLVVSRDVLTGRTVRFPAEAVVLVMGYRGARGAQELGGLLRVPTDGDGFFTEAHVKLRPLDFATQGIHIAGCARSPKGARESIEEGLGAAMRALIPMCRGYVESEGVVALVEEEKCTGCGLCAKSCPFSAIELVERAGAPGTVGSAGGEGASGARAGAARRPRILAALCRGCGICAADCPSDAIQILHFTDEQILAQIEAALAEGAGSKILALCCHWCALGAADMAGVSRIQYPPNVRIIRVMCSGRVDARWVERALELGAGAVVVAGCEFPTCHYIDGNWSAKRRLEKLAASLERRGLPAARLHTVWLSAAEGARFAEAMSSIARGLGPAAEGRSSGGKVPRKSPS